MSLVVQVALTSCFCALYRVLGTEDAADAEVRMFRCCTHPSIQKKSKHSLMYHAYKKQVYKNVAMNLNWKHELLQLLIRMLCIFFEVCCSGNIPHLDAVRLHKHTLKRTHTNTHTHWHELAHTHQRERARTHTQTHTFHVHALNPLLLLWNTHTLTQTLTHTHAHAGFSQRARSLLVRSLRCCCSYHTFSPCQLKKELLALTTGVCSPLSRQSSRFSISFSVPFTLNVSLYLCT